MITARPYMHTKEHTCRWCWVPNWPLPKPLHRNVPNWNSEIRWVSSCVRIAIFLSRGRYLIYKRLAINTLSSLQANVMWIKKNFRELLHQFLRQNLPISMRDVAPLSHEVFDDSVKLCTLIGQLAVSSCSTSLPSTKSLRKIQITADSTHKRSP